MIHSIGGTKTEVKAGGWSKELTLRPAAPSP